MKNKNLFLTTLSLFILLTLFVILNKKQPFNLDQIVNTFTYPSQFLPFLEFISSITEELIIGIAGLFLFIYLRIKNKNKESWCAFTLIIGAVLLKVLKITISRIRPNGNFDYQSFPSGHVTMTTILSIIFYFSIIKDLKNILIKNTLKVIAIALPILVAISRLALNHHWFTDVIGGFLLGTAIGIGGYFYISNPHKLFK